MYGLFLGRGRVLAAMLMVTMVLAIAAAACVTDPSEAGVLVSMKDPGVTGDGVAYGREDIIGAVNVDPGPDNWELVFDGSEQGLTPDAHVGSFTPGDLIAGLGTADFEDMDTLYISFSPNRVRVPGIGGWVYGNDIVRWEENDVDPGDPGTFEIFFDGSDVGLTTVDEKLDGISVVTPDVLAAWMSANDVEIPYDCSAGVIFATTQATYSVPGANGKPLKGKGSDVLLFCAFNTGADTAGLWFRVFKGSYVNFSPPNTVMSLDVDNFYLVEQPEEGDVDLVAAMSFFFTGRLVGFSADGILGSQTGQHSQLYRAGTLTGVTGPYIDFNSGVQVAPVNGKISGVSIYDFVPAP